MRPAPAELVRGGPMGRVGPLRGSLGSTGSGIRFGSPAQDAGRVPRPDRKTFSRASVITAMASHSTSPGLPTVQTRMQPPLPKSRILVVDDITRNLQVVGTVLRN